MSMQLNDNNDRYWSSRGIDIGDFIYDDDTNNFSKGNKMTQSQFNKILKEVRRIQEDGPFDDEAAYDMADFILMDNPGLKEYIQTVIGAYDAIGWLADEI